MQEKNELPEGIGLDWVPEFPGSVECHSGAFPGRYFATRRDGELIVARQHEKMSGTGQVKKIFTKLEISERKFFHNFKKTEQ